MLSAKKAGELLRKHFAELTPEAFLEELRQFAPQAIELSTAARPPRTVIANATRRPAGGRHQRHIVPNPKGGWDVKDPNASRASSHHATQAEAEARAKEILGNVGGGEAVIHGRDGRIRDSDTVAPGNDPAPLIDQA